MKVSPIIAGYQLEQQLATGGATTLFTARDPHGQLRAAKIFHTSHSSPHQPDLVTPDTHFVAELIALQRLSHPNIVTLIDFGMTQDTSEHYLLMELLHGTTITQAARDATAQEFYTYLIQLCRALQHVHASGFVHGDIKPDNIIIHESYRDSARLSEAKLIDFSHSRQTTSLHLTGVAGTPQYMAPEVLRGSPSSPASDLYSFGLVMRECLLSPTPPSQENLPTVIANRLSPHEKTVEYENSSGAWQLVRALLADDPSKRPANANDVIRFLSALPLPGSLSVAPEPPEERLRGIPDIGMPMDAVMRHIPHLMLRQPVESAPLILIEGERGSGKSLFLQNIAAKATILGYRVNRLPGEFSEWAHFVRELVKSKDVASYSPTVVIVDDLRVQVCERSQCEQFIRDLRRVATAIIATTSPTSEIAFRAAAELSGLPSADGEVFQYELPPWGARVTLQAIKALTGVTSVEESLFDEVWSATAGNPRLTCELLASGFQARSFTATSGSLRMKGPTATITCSEELQCYLSAILRHLSSEEAGLFRLLAVAEDPLTADEVAELVEGTTTQVGTSLERFSDLGIVRTSRDTRLRYCIPWGLLRRTALGSITGEALRGLHSQVGGWYTRSSDDRSIEKAAIHLAAALDRRGALLFSVKAARRALVRSDDRTAVRFLKSSLEQAPLHPEQRVSLRVDLAEALIRLGRLREASAELSLERDSHDIPTSSRATLYLTQSRCSSAMGDLSQSARWAKRSRSEAKAAGDQSLLVHATIKLGDCHVRMGNLGYGSRLLARACARSRRASLWSLTQGAMSSLSFTLWQEGKYKRALRLLRRAYWLSSGGAVSPAMNLRLLNIGVLQMDLGHFKKAALSFDKALSAAQELGHFARVAAVLTNQGELSRHVGQWSNALARYREGIRVATGTGARSVAYIANLNSARVYSETGHFRESIACLRGSLKDRAHWSSREARTALWPSWLALQLLTGRLAAGNKMADKLLSRKDVKEQWDLYVEIACFKALSCSEAGDYGSAETELKKIAQLDPQRRSLDIDIAAALTRLSIGQTHNPDLQNEFDDLDRLITLTRNKNMAWHLVRALLIRGAAFHMLRRERESASDFMEAIQVARRSKNRLSFWQANYWLGRVYEQKLQYERALKKYRIAALTIHEIALELDEDKYKRPFLAQAKVRDALERYGRLTREVGKKARYDMATVSRSERVSRKMLGALNAIGQKLTSILDLHDLLKELLDLSIENVQAERGIIFLADEGQGELRPTLARGMDKESLDGIESFSKTVIQQVATGSTLLTIDVGQDPTLSAYKSLVLHEIKSILAVPMRTRRKTVGVIYLDTQKGPQLFTDREKAFVESFASQAAIAIENARLFGQISSDNVRLRREAEARSRFENLIGTSAAMKKLGDTIESVLASECNVLILGESGTGKELVARAIHYNGPRRKKKFVAIDCGALPENLLEAELFGYARGAFTGAERERIGLIEEARGGTLFLDEITNTSVGLQSRLLRVLQEKEVRRLGENTARAIDIRVIAATNAAIKSLMDEGKFRQDLYYRLNVVSIQTPPLRERREDIPLLADHFLKQQAGKEGAPKRLGPGVGECLARHDWPGNVRELSNVIERAHLLSASNLITRDDLPEAFRPSSPGSERSPGGGGQKCGEQLMIEDALRRFAGDKAKAARFIGWNRQKLYRRMREFGISTEYGQAA